MSQMVSRTPTPYNLTLASADTQYSQALPANCRYFSVQCRTGYDVRIAFVTGKVATSTAPFFTIKAGAGYNSPENFDGANSLQGEASALTLYAASAQAGVVLEILCWT